MSPVVNPRSGHRARSAATRRNGPIHDAPQVTDRRAKRRTSSATPDAPTRSLSEERSDETKWSAAIRRPASQIHGCRNITQLLTDELSDQPERTFHVKHATTPPATERGTKRRDEMLAALEEAPPRSMRARCATTKHDVRGRRPTARSLSEEGSDEARFPATLDRRDQAASRTQHHPPVVERDTRRSRRRGRPGKPRPPLTAVSRETRIATFPRACGRRWLLEQCLYGSADAETADPDRRSPWAHRCTWNTTGIHS